MNTPPMSARSGLWRPSPTLSITARAKQLKAEGKDVVSLGVGEPDFDTPAEVVEAAEAALERGDTKYVPTPGTPTLRQAIAEKLGRDNGIEVGPDQVIVSCGAKQSLFNAVMTLVDPGDEVVVFAPYWMTYVDQIVLAGGRPVAVESFASTGFVPSVDEFKEALSDKTKAVILNSPCNPTGAVFPPETLRAIATVAAEKGLWIIADEIYEKLVYGVTHLSVASIGPEIAERTVTVNGCSKSYAMTGWRIGYAAAPKPVVQAMSNLQDQTTSNATSFAQAGAVAALRMSPDQVERMRVEFEHRRDRVCEMLGRIDALETPVPQGAFYVFTDVSRHLGDRFPDDHALTRHLLDEALVATVPGSVFGSPGHLRLSYAASREELEKGVGRIADTLARSLT